jgi:hypothetical protein
MDVSQVELVDLKASYPICCSMFNSTLQQIKNFFFLHEFMQYFFTAKGLTIKIDLGLIDQLLPMLYLIFTNISI